jgi:hypothetical protein
MEEAIRKIIKRIVLPKYPWIDDFVLVTDKEGKVSTYHVYYYTDKDWIENNDLFNNVKSDTKILYYVLGPDDHKDGRNLNVSFKKNYTK